MTGPVHTQADLFGLGHTFELDGTAYEFRPLDQLQQGQLQRHLEQRAREAVGRAVDLPERERDELLRGVIEDIACGRYEYHGSVCSRYLQSVEGMTKLVELACRVDREAAKRIVLKRIELISKLIAAKVKDDPKAVAAALAGLGLPPDLLSSGASSSPSSTPPSTDPSPKSPDSPTPSSGASGPN